MNDDRTAQHGLPEDAPLRVDPPPGRTGSSKPPRILLIDNFDSFVFNLARYFEELGMRPEVVRNDAVSVSTILEDRPAALVLSPGPGLPADAGICEELVHRIGPAVPLLGVCLGHQAIASAWGASIVRAPGPVHGRTSQVQHDHTGLFEGCPQPLQATRYHSLIVDPKTVPANLQITARLTDGTIMALQHTAWPVFGVQFHPESILSESGHRVLANFLRLAGLKPVLPEPAGDHPQTRDNLDDFYRRQIGPDALRPG